MVVERKLIRGAKGSLVKQNWTTRRMTINELKEQSGLAVSKSTIQQTLHEKSMRIVLESVACARIRKERKRGS